MFKAGDKIKCIDNSLYTEHLSLGEVYTVESSEPTFVWIQGSTWGSNHNDRFELAEEDAVKKTEFQVGDLVECIKTAGRYAELIQGQMYTVTELRNGEVVVGGNYSYCVSRFKLVPTISVTLSLTTAKDYLRDNPHSKYLKPALETLETDKITFPYVVKNFDDLKRFDVKTTVVIGADTVNFKPWTRWGTDWVRENWGGTPRYGDVEEAWNEIKYHAPTVLSSPFTGEATEVTFKIPVEEARDIGGCTLPALVEAWDKENAPENPMYTWLKEMKPSTAFRSKGGGNLYVKNSKDASFISFGFNSGAPVSHPTLDVLAEGLNGTPADYDIV